jgi:hypothetical protein
MPSTSEEAFVQAANRLDQLLVNAQGELRDVQSRDTSARTYHYKNQVLVWSHEFDCDWIVDIDHYRVSVSISFVETPEVSAEPQISVRRRAEIFRTGKQSHVIRTGAKYVHIEDVAKEGIAALVKDELNAGRADLANAA